MDLPSSFSSRGTFYRRFKRNFARPLPWAPVSVIGGHLTNATHFQSLGGRVESKVPRQGYILVQHGTPEEERLRICWKSPDRPERIFVPYSFVEACKIAGMLLKQIFLENGEPIKMHIHPSIANPNARNALSQRIMVKAQLSLCKSGFI